MKMVVQSFQAPRWLVPVFVILALAVLPFAFLFALALLGLGLGAAVLRSFLPSSQRPGSVILDTEKSSEVFSNPSVIDADYEVKDENEKDR